MVELQRNRVLSLEEADQMLPLLGSIVKDIQKTWITIVEHRDHIGLITQTLDRTKSLPDDLAKTNVELKEQLSAQIDRINNYIFEVEELGCFVEEFKRGVLNFPSLYLGRKVFLCWTPEDGDKIKHWHELDESYSERSDISNRRDFFTKPV